jgi:ribonuclease BN (tRNA processing enzyme)
MNPKHILLFSHGFGVYQDDRGLFGIRFGSYAIAGDANLNDNLIKLLKNVRLGIFDAGHLTDDEIVELAMSTQAETLVCTHQYRILDEVDLNERAKSRGFTGTLVIARDLMEFAIESQT